MNVDERVAGWADLVPAPLVQHAAIALCGQDDGPCDDCVEEAARVLAYAYAFNDKATLDDPCLACELVRPDPADIHLGCLFHVGLDQGVVDGPEPYEEREGRVVCTIEPPIEGVEVTASIVTAADLNATIRRQAGPPDDGELVTIGDVINRRWPRVGPWITRHWHWVVAFGLLAMWLALGIAESFLL